MSVVTKLSSPELPGVCIEPAGAHDDGAAEALWSATEVRARRDGAPAVRLVARDAASGRLLGTADYFRTFPPEDVLASVAVAPDARRRGIGTALLRALARLALEDGRRNVAGFVAKDDAATWGLLSAAGLPVRVYGVNGGVYVELDLVPLLAERRHAVRRHTRAAA